MKRFVDEDTLVHYGSPVMVTGVAETLCEYLWQIYVYPESTLKLTRKTVTCIACARYKMAMDR